MTIKIPNKISASFLQRKFKLSYEIAKAICDLANVSSLESGWFDVNQNPLTTYGENVLVYARPIHCADKNHFRFFIAHFNASCGWIKQDDENFFLYVTHYKLLERPENEEPFCSPIGPPSLK